MQLSQAGGQSRLSHQDDLWRLVQARRVAQLRRQEGLEFVEDRLGSLLLGQDLNAEQQGQYARRLSGTAALAGELARGPEVPDPAPARVPREKMVLRAGGVSWRPFPVTQRAVAVTPLHRRLQSRMALALKDSMAGAPQLSRTCVHSVSFAVQRGGTTLGKVDQDKVELTGWGIEMMALQDSLAKPPTLPPPPAIALATVGPAPTATSLR